jgi:hypothetical protein
VASSARGSNSIKSKGDGDEVRRLGNVPISEVNFGAPINAPFEDRF